MDDRKTVKPDTRPQTLKNIRSDKGHSLSIEDRKKLSLTGILSVESFNDQEIILETVLGMLIVKGSSLHVNRLNVESGDVMIDGEVNSCIYSQKQDIKTKGAGFFSKLFK